MGPDFPQGHQLSNHRMSDDASWQFERQHFFLEALQTKLSSSSIKSETVNEQEKIDTLRLYEREKKYSLGLRMNIERLNIELQSCNKLYKDLLKTANDEKDEIKQQFNKSIKTLTQENLLLKKSIEENCQIKETLYKKNKEFQKENKQISEKLTEYQQELTACKYQAALSRKSIKQLSEMLQKGNDLNKTKQEEINRLTGLLNDAESEKKNQFVSSQKFEIEDSKQKVALFSFSQIYEQEYGDKKIDESRKQIEKCQQIEKPQKQQQYKNQFVNVSEGCAENRYNSKVDQNDEAERENSIVQKRQREIQEKNQEIERLNKLLEENKQNFENLKQSAILKINGQQRKVSIMVEKLFSKKSLEIHSDVIMNEKELEALSKMFTFKKKVIGFQLLFKASNYYFDVKYKEKYCGVGYTVLLVKTEYGKVIGGYTPLKWKISSFEDGEMQFDASGQSFIFSLTNNHKLTLQSGTKNEAIYHHNKFGPTFCRGIGINNKSDSEKKSCALYSNTLDYMHPEYKANDKESSIAFSGSSDFSFHTKEWEVHRVIFED